jgi:hypothetical protein
MAVVVIAVAVKACGSPDERMADRTPKNTVTLDGATATVPLFTDRGHHRHRSASGTKMKEAAN